MRRLIYLMPVLLFLVVAGYFAWSLRPGHDPQLLPSALIDKPVPAFDIARLPGTGRLTQADLTPAATSSAGTASGAASGAAAPSVSSADSADQPATLVNFFASWCAPCRVEHPILMELAKRGTVRLIGIAYKDKPDDAARFLAQLGNPYQLVGLDLEGRTGVDFGAYGVPETYVIDRAGRIRHRFVGPLTPEAVERVLMPLLRQLGGVS